MLGHDRIRRHLDGVLVADVECIALEASSPSATSFAAASAAARVRLVRR